MPTHSSAYIWSQRPRSTLICPSKGISIAAQPPAKPHPSRCFSQSPSHFPSQLDFSPLGSTRLVQLTWCGSPHSVRPTWPAHSPSFSIQMVWLIFVRPLAMITLPLGSFPTSHCVQIASRRHWPISVGPFCLDFCNRPTSLRSSNSAPDNRTLWPHWFQSAPQSRPLLETPVCPARSPTQSKL